MTGSQQPSGILARRVVVTAAGAASLAAALSACGGAEDAGGPSSPQKPTGPGDATSRSASGGSDGEELAKTADIPEGGGKIVGDVVITQPRAGEFKAFSAKCTHRGCTVAGVERNVINCPCHESYFDAADGTVKSGPATAPLPPAPITVDRGTIRLA